MGTIWIVATGPVSVLVVATIQCQFMKVSNRYFLGCHQLKNRQNDCRWEQSQLTLSTSATIKELISVNDDNLENCQQVSECPGCCGNPMLAYEGKQQICRRCLPLDMRQFDCRYPTTATYKACVSPIC